MKSLSFKIERSTSMRIDKNGSRSISNNRNQTNRFDDYSDDQPEDSDDDDDGYGNGKNSSKRRIQMITDFDSTRESKLERKEGSSLSIPMLPNKDFRAIHMARKNRRNKKELYKPDSANPLGSTQPSTNHNQIKSNDQEGVDQMNSKAIIGGLKVVKQELRLVEELKDIQSDPTPRQGEEPLTADIENTTTIITSKTTTTAETTEVIDNAKPVERSESGANDTKENLREEESIEQRAVRELLSQSGDQALELKELDPIRPPTPSEDQETDSAQGSDESADEIAQFRRDISKRPDSSTLEDYERVPVGQFGLALMKGMGWKEGTSTSRRGRVGLVEAYIPQARPTLLGIGAKPLDLEADSKQKGDRSDGKSKRTSKNDKRYVPLLRKVIDQGRAGGQTDSALSSSQASSQSPSSSRSSSVTAHSSRAQSPSSRRDREDYRSDSSRYDRPSTSKNDDRYDSKRTDERRDRRSNVADGYSRSGGRSSRTDDRDDDNRHARSSSSRTERHRSSDDRYRSSERRDHSHHRDEKGYRNDSSRERR